MKLARLEGLEPPAHGLEGRCSIQLSYRRKPQGPLLQRALALREDRSLPLTGKDYSTGCPPCQQKNFSFSDGGLPAVTVHGPGRQPAAAIAFADALASVQTQRF